MVSSGHEDQVLLAAAHPSRSPERQQRLSRLLAIELNWSHIISDADRHRVAPLLDQHLRSSVIVPVEARESLASSARNCMVWNLRLRHELARLLAAFAEAGVDVMPLKGPVLADRLYPDPLLRSADDLDLLVRPADHEAAERVLGTLRYRRLPVSEQGAGYHTIFMSGGVEAAAVAVELHRELGEHHVSRPDVCAIWAAAAPGTWQGQPVWSMAPCDLLLYLCFHAAKDGLASLRALLDIALLVEGERNAIAWPMLAASVHAARLGTPVCLALLHARDLVGAPVPAEFLEAIRPRGPRWHVARALLRWRGGLLHAPPERIVGVVMAILMLVWEDSRRGWLRHLRRNLLPAPELRARWASTPADASILRWYPVWVWRVGSTVVRQLTSRTHGDGA